MNLFADIRDLVVESLNAMVTEGALPTGLELTNVSVEPPRDSSYGDMATNAAMVLAKAAALRPREIADKLAVRLAEDGRIASAKVAGPGFINLRLNESVWSDVVAFILASGGEFGRSRIGAGKRVDSGAQLCCTSRLSLWFWISGVLAEEGEYSEEARNGPVLALT